MLSVLWLLIVFVILVLLTISLCGIIAQALYMKGWICFVYILYTIKRIHKIMKWFLESHWIETVSPWLTLKNWNAFVNVIIGQVCQLHYNSRNASQWYKIQDIMWYHYDMVSFPEKKNHYTEYTPHSSPVRVRYGVSFVSTNYDLSCNSQAPAMLYEISWHTGAHYNRTAEPNITCELSSVCPKPCFGQSFSMKFSP